MKVNLSSYLLFASRVPLSSAPSLSLRSSRRRRVFSQPSAKDSAAVHTTAMLEKGLNIYNFTYVGLDEHGPDHPR